MTPEPIDIDTAELEALIQRLQQAKDYQLALSGEDIDIVLSALMTLSQLQAQLDTDSVTIHKLKKLLGMVSSSEKLRHLVREGGQGETEDDAHHAAAEAAEQARQQQRDGDKKRARKRRKKKPRAKTQPDKILHPLTTLDKGSACPCCNPEGDTPGGGKVYKYEPAQFLRISGHSPLKATLHISERVRCNSCGEFFTAELPEDVKADGAGQQKYGFSARTVMALHKYFAGSPFYRQQSLQDLLGLPLTASTVYDQCEYVANALFPLFLYLKALAADAVHFHLDDTTNRILDQQPIEKPRRNSNKKQLRSGIYTSGVIATLDAGQQVVLFQTNIGHAGEWMDEILALRAAQAPPLLMSDALASNRPTVTVDRIHTLCNAHARRQFVDVMTHFPKDVAELLSRYQRIWENEDKVIEQALSPAKRLAYHREHSLPVMQGIRDWGQTLLADGTVEENSGLGQAIRYFDRHYDGLCAFCHYEGAKIDNNVMEGQLKLVVRNRKNAYFYKTLAGAGVADVITSVIATADQAGINVFDYFNAVQRNAAAVRANPENWLPWNYAE